MEELQTIARQIIPDLASGPFYVVMAGEPDLPAEYRCYGCRAFTSVWLDVGLAGWLRERGLWQGRGPAIVLNDAALRIEANQDADENGALADELYQSRLTAVLVHELGHVVEGPIDYTDPGDIDLAITQATAVVHEWIAAPPAAPVPWHGHGADWLRLAVHVQHRAETILNRRLPVGWICGDGYGLAPYLRYRSALGDEPERLRGETFETVRSANPPETFVELWRADLDRWFFGIDTPSIPDLETFRQMRMCFSPSTQKEDENVPE